ncbi:CidA/LrgA family protein [Plesiomonas shigelloides]|uniref:CidA/LrgA family protein n=1 Tax=Plesiomonas shigelloides TaxID=703 RepID=UPI001E3ECFE7|nr:CidA/LrgA family protein [Plesiomonas shigelloides]
MLSNLMSQYVSNVWGYARAFVLIFACLWVGNSLSAWLHLNIPGSIIGMLVLFILLSLQIVKADWVKPGCYLFIRYMAVLFIPIGVGLINHYRDLSSSMGAFLVSTTVSTLIVMTAVSVVYQRIHAKSDLMAGTPDSPETVEAEQPNAANSNKADQSAARGNGEK